MERGGATTDRSGRQEVKEESGQDLALLTPTSAGQGAEERRLAETRTATLTQTPPIRDVDGDNLNRKDQGSRTSMFAATPPSAQHKSVAEHAKTSPTPVATATALVAAFGGRQPVSPDREQDAAPFADSDHHLHCRKEIVGRQGQQHSTHLTSITAAAKEVAEAAPETVALPKRWTLTNKIGAKTSPRGTPKKPLLIRDDPRRSLDGGGSAMGGSGGKIPSSRRTVSGGRSGWALLNTEKNATKAFRKAQKSAAAAETRRRARKQRWVGLKALRQTASTLMHALNVSSNDIGDETSSSSTEDEDAGAGAEDSGSEHSSSIWREISDSDCFSSSDMDDFDEEVGVRARTHAREGKRVIGTCESFVQLKVWSQANFYCVSLGRKITMIQENIHEVNSESCGRFRGNKGLTELRG